MYDLVPGTVLYGSSQLLGKTGDGRTDDDAQRARLTDRKAHVEVCRCSPQAQLGGRGMRFRAVQEHLLLVGSNLLADVARVVVHTAAGHARCTSAHDAQQSSLCRRPYVVPSRAPFTCTRRATRQRRDAPVGDKPPKASTRRLTGSARCRDRPHNSL